MIKTIKNGLKDEFRIKGKRRKSNKKLIENELIELEKINNLIIDKIASTISPLVQQ